MSEPDHRRTTTAVVGPGAIGLVIAAAAVEAGNPPVVGARSPFDAVTIDDGTGARTHPLDVRCDPGSIEGPVDVVFLATKVHQTEAAAGWLRAWCGPGTVVAVCQNGIDQRERLARHVAPGRIAPVVVNLPATRHGTGEVTTVRWASLAVPDDGPGRAVAAALAGSFLRIRIVDDWWSEAWFKLLINSSTGILGVLTGAPSGVTVADPEGRWLLGALVDEAAAVGRATGAVIPDDAADRIADRILSGAPDHHSSIALDRLAGRPTEWEARNLVVVDLAQQHGIDVPLHRAGTALIRLGEPRTG